MPYSNVPKHLESKMERCVAEVKKKGKGKNAYAICYSSIVGDAVRKEAGRRSGKGK